MAKATLPTNFKDDIMNASMGGKRKYNLIQNTDGTVSLEDVTTYDQVGSNFGSGQINQTNTAVNAAADAGKIIDDLTTIKATTQKGYIAGALALKEINNNLGGIEFIFDESGKITGYKSKAGADTVHPFTKTAKYHIRLNWWNGEINPSEQIAVTIFNENNQQVLRMSGNFSYSTWQQDRYFDVTV